MVGGARTRVAVIFGGRSGEHAVSVQSARAIVRALDAERFEAVPIGIDRQGHWRRVTATALLSGSDYAGEVGRDSLAGPVASTPHVAAVAEGAGGFGVDVFFPIVHGPLGEDGSLQGLLEMANVPYVGCGVLGSAVAMDKDVAKRLLREAGLPVVPWIALRSRAALSGELATRVGRELGYPCFVKPAHLGSSLGVSKVRGPHELSAAIELAFGSDDKVLIERGVDAREIETAVLGSLPAQVSVPGEVVPRHDFYSYEAKYLDEEGAELRVPAPLEAAQAQEVSSLSVKAFDVLELEGMARIDFFLARATGEWFVNEVNTLPGFTEISMYARMWHHSGLAFPDLLSRLIELAFARHERRQSLSPPPARAP